MHLKIKTISSIQNRWSVSFCFAFWFWSSSCLAWKVKAAKRSFAWKINQAKKEGKLRMDYEQSGKFIERDNADNNHRWFWHRVQNAGNLDAHDEKVCFNHKVPRLTNRTCSVSDLNCQKFIPLSNCWLFFWEKFDFGVRILVEEGQIRRGFPYQIEYTPLFELTLLFQIEYTPLTYSPQYLHL